MPAVEARNIGKRFGALLALDSCSFSVDAGQALCLYGPSGSGKTTALRIVAGLETPDQGEVLIQDCIATTPAKLLPPDKRGIGMVFQNRGLWPHMRAEKHVDFVLKRSVRDTASRRHEVDRILERCRIAHRRRAYPHEMSGGEQQRLAIARTLAPAPSILLLDEPLTNLDEDLRTYFLDEFRTEMKRGAAIILSTHIREEAEALDAALIPLGEEN